MTDKVLVTCPPMLGLKEELSSLLQKTGWDLHLPNVVQTLSETQLIELLPGFDGWIIGDDPASARVLQAGKSGRLRAAVKWGVGVDNVDFKAAEALGLPVTNTPGMFGREVADIAIAYVVALARETFLIDRSVRAGGWPKPKGTSLASKTMGLVGFGDIGRNIAKRALAADMSVKAYDPFFKEAPGLDVEHAHWPKGLSDCDFVVLCCALTKDNRHMLNAETLEQTKPGVRIVNVARGPLIETEALIEALKSGQVHSAALDVMEVEPLPSDSKLRDFERCIFGSHNASNTKEAAFATSEKAIALLQGFLGR